MKLTKTANGKKVLKLSKSEWQRIGKKAKWLKESAIGIDEAIGGLGSGIAQGGEEKAKEYAQRIIGGEPREKVLQGATPIMIQKVNTYIQQLQRQQLQRQPYSLSKSEQWAMSTGDPNIIEFVNNINTKAKYQGSQYVAQEIQLIMQAMTGNQSAIQQLKQKFQAQPLK